MFIFLSFRMKDKKILVILLILSDLNFKLMAWHYDF